MAADIDAGEVFGGRDQRGVAAQGLAIGFESPALLPLPLQHQAEVVLGLGEGGIGQRRLPVELLALLQVDHPHPALLIVLLVGLVELTDGLGAGFRGGPGHRRGLGWRALSGLLGGAQATPRPGGPDRRRVERGVASEARLRFLGLLRGWRGRRSGRLSRGLRRNGRRMLLGRLGRRREFLGIRRRGSRRCGGWGGGGGGRRRRSGRGRSGSRAGALPPASGPSPRCRSARPP